MGNRPLQRVVVRGEGDCLPDLNADNHNRRQSNDDLQTAVRNGTDDVGMIYT